MSLETLEAPAPIRSLREVAAEVRRRRKALRLTQRELAAVAGVSRDTVIAFESAAPRAPRPVEGEADGQVDAPSDEGVLGQDVSFERVLALLSALGLGLVCVGDARAEGQKLVDARADGALSPAASFARGAQASPSATPAVSRDAAPSMVGRFDPSGAARLRWARSADEPSEQPIDPDELTAAQRKALRTLAARYVQWMTADEAASHPSRVLARAMDLREDGAHAAKPLLDRFSVELLGRALRYGRANGWFPSGGDTEWEAALAARATSTKARRKSRTRKAA